MKHLDEVVQHYLKTDTNYALLITGDWGAGKTYYLKNVLKDKISEISCGHDANIKYQPIIVSLFGLNSIEDIQQEILLSLFPFLKNKSLKLGVSLGKALIKGAMHFKGLGSFYDSLEEVKIDKGEFLDLNELVICFDDLERATSFPLRNYWDLLIL